MPSPFPGMDPFIECQEWEDFHSRLSTAISDFLSPQLGLRYIVRVERRIYVEHVGDDDPRIILSDAAVLVSPWKSWAVSEETAASVAMAVAPVECELPMPEERRESYLVIRHRETMEVVTVLETLSPTNKRPGSDGRREYLAKREQVLQSKSHLVELDLLRGGQRLPTVRPLPPGDYYAIVSRRNKRPKAMAYGWTLRQPIPPIAIPLLREDPDVTLDLQSVVATVYDRARYDRSIDYQRPLEPPPSPDDAQWIRELVAGQSSS